jgi:hypothetical protein
MPTPLYFYFIVISFLAGITVYFRKNMPLYLKILPAFLFLTIIVEFVGVWASNHTGTSTKLYNFYIAFNFSFYLFLLREIISNPKLKKANLITIIIYAVYAIINFFYIQGPDVWNSMSYSLGCLLVVAFCIYFFLELFRKPKLTKLTSEPAFWIVSGLLFFYACSFPFLGLNNLVQHTPLGTRMTLNTILTVLNILLYILFSIAFLCQYNFRRPRAGKIEQESRKFEQGILK